MTFAVLRALHAVIGEAIEDIERVYSSQSQPSPSPCASSCLAGPYASPPPTPSTACPAISCSSSIRPDFPSLDIPYDPTSVGEVLTSDPVVVEAISRIIAASGQLAATVQNPFLTLCDAAMNYHLPSCLRLLEASHAVEILREAGLNGMHVDVLSEKTGVEKSKLAHILRLLCTHHLMRELSPNTFTINRVSSLIDSGKTLSQLREYEKSGRPEYKYRETDGIAAFVGLCTDELQKSSAYLTEAYLLSSSPSTRLARDPTRAPFCFAFGCIEEGRRSPQTKGVGYFAWLEGERHSALSNGAEIGTVNRYPPARSTSTPSIVGQPPGNKNQFRLERFGYAMNGTCLWDAPGTVLKIFPWHELPEGSVIVDVGGGIGSTTMILATALLVDGSQLTFVIQDREQVCQMGEKAWRDQCPSLLESGAVVFQVHDFFQPQLVKNAAVFYLRVILHDWPDSFARRILLRLREAALDNTTLIISDFVLPLACVDGSDNDEDLQQIEGAQCSLAQPPLLANMGKASSIAYWMDLTMQVTFNAQERTLREVVSLTASAGWKVKKVTRVAGSLFGHIIAVPTVIPSKTAVLSAANSDQMSPNLQATSTATQIGRPNVLENNTNYTDSGNAYSRSGTPTFCSRTILPRAAASKLHGQKGSDIGKSRIPTFKMGNPIPLRKRPLPTVPTVQARTQTPGPGKAAIITPTGTPANMHSTPTPLLRNRRLSNALKLSPVGVPLSPSSPMQPNPTSVTGSSAHQVVRRRASHAGLPFLRSKTSSPVPPVPPVPALPSTLGSPVSIKDSKGIAATPVLRDKVRQPSLARRASSATLTMIPQRSPSAGESSIGTAPKMGAAGSTHRRGVSSRLMSPIMNKSTLHTTTDTSPRAPSFAGHNGAGKVLEAPARLEKTTKKWVLTL
ncbi:hypothetical protein AX16_000790 [Volvariella volvacea WC 439]|nr:hypothetical protein AX16_000790 [Volvariella volvacea WC 439]